MTETGQKPATLSGLFWTTFRIGLFSLGGGITALYYREFVVRRKWLDEPAFFAALSVARVLPGTNVSNFAVIAGFELRGIKGATVALFGLLAAPFVIVLLLMQLYLHLRHPLVDAALGGAASAAIGLIALMIYRSLRHLGRDWFALALAFGVATAIGLFNLPLGPIVLVVVPVAFVAVLIWGRKDA